MKFRITELPDSDEQFVYLRLEMVDDIILTAQRRTMKYVTTICDTCSVTIEDPTDVRITSSPTGEKCILNGRHIIVNHNGITFQVGNRLEIS